MGEFNFFEAVAPAAEAAVSRPMVHRSKDAAKAHAVCNACGVELEVLHLAGMWVVDPCASCLEAANRRELGAWRAVTVRAWKDRLVEMFGQVHVETRVELLLELEALLEREDTDPWAVYLYGPAGTGKTQQACELIKAAGRRRVKRYTHKDALAHSAQPDSSLVRVKGDTSEYGMRPAAFPPYVAVGEMEMLESLRPDGGCSAAHYAGAKLLVLDDIGTARGTDWVYEKLWAIIDHRYRHKLKTVFTSNVAVHELAKAAAYDARLATRIMEMCGLPHSSQGIVHMTTQHRLGGGS